MDLFRSPGIAPPPASFAAAFGPASQHPYGRRRATHCCDDCFPLGLDAPGDLEIDAVGVDQEFEEYFFE